MTTKFVAISDTHTQLNKIVIPEGDILLHAGDLTYNGSLAQMLPELDILAELKKRFKHIIIVAGNHDFMSEKQSGLMLELCTERDIIYLEHQPTIQENFNIFGSPYSSKYGRWAFGLERGVIAKNTWSQVLENTDILITHGPPKDILDKTTVTEENVGCEELFKRTIKIKPKYHIFGHIHEGYGKYFYNNTYYINASTCNLNYEPVNPPIIFEL